ncbi:MAG: hypothetical protein AAB362_00095 [Patescibacteria group bacterium]
MKLIFVYNADSDFISSLKDITHKVVSPKTYPCNLCRITYPYIAMNKEWKDFIALLPYQVVFLHRDEFGKQYVNQKSMSLPALFVEDASDIRLLISNEEINKVKNISELIKITKHSLQIQSNSVIYRCSECGLGYGEKEIAEKCQAWCKEHKSCNLDLIKYAIKENGN